jgi:hypothetical protein
MGDLVNLGTSIFAIESSFWRPGTALSLAFTLVCVFLVLIKMGRILCNKYMKSLTFIYHNRT